jgi:hypothetical protein
MEKQNQVAHRFPTQLRKTLFTIHSRAIHGHSRYAVGKNLSATQRQYP